MSYRQDGTAATYAICSQAVLSAEPITIAAWLKNPTPLLQPQIAAINTGSGTTRNSFVLASVGAGAGNGGAVAVARSGATAGQATASAAGLGPGWHHLGAIFASTTSRSAWWDGVLTATNTTSKTLSGMDTTSIGTWWDNGAYINPGSNPYYIAEIAIWNALLTPREFLDARLGKPHNLIRPDALVMYLPLRSETGLKDFGPRNLIFTNTGLIASQDHPPIILPRRRSYLANSVAAAAPCTPYFYHQQIARMAA